VRRTLAYRLTSWKCQDCATALAEVQLVALATVAGQRTLKCQKLKAIALRTVQISRIIVECSRLLGSQSPATDRASNDLYTRFQSLDSLERPQSKDSGIPCLATLQCYPFEDTGERQNSLRSHVRISITNLEKNEIFNY
jgi:hypothetical protein